MARVSVTKMYETSCRQLTFRIALPIIDTATGISLDFSLKE